MHMAGPENAARCARGSTGTWFREPIRRPISALKGSWSKYYRNYDGDIAANAYGRAGERSEMRTWLDRNLVSGTNTPTDLGVEGQLEQVLSELRRRYRGKCIWQGRRTQRDAHVARPEPGFGNQYADRSRR